MTFANQKKAEPEAKWDFGMRLLVAALGFFWILLVAAAWAEADSGMGRGNEDDEYNFNWLDPDKKIYVLQNRKYLKSGHPVLSLMGGGGFSNPYRDTINADGRFAYYINETWGLELFYTYTSNSSNSAFDALAVAAPNTLPFIREIRGQFGGELHFVPWYAKINVFNNILYFDWYFGAGAGSIQSYVNTTKTVGAAANYVQDNLTGIFLSTGHFYHLSQSFLVRIDITAALYEAHINGFTGDSSWYSNINFGAGIGWRL